MPAYLCGVVIEKHKWCSGVLVNRQVVMSHTDVAVSANDGLLNGTGQWTYLWETTSYYKNCSPQWVIQVNSNIITCRVQCKVMAAVVAWMIPAPVHGRECVLLLLVSWCLGGHRSGSRRWRAVFQRRKIHGQQHGRVDGSCLHPFICGGVGRSRGFMAAWSQQRRQEQESQCRRSVVQQHDCSYDTTFKLKNNYMWLKTQE